MVVTLGLVVMVAMPNNLEAQSSSTYHVFPQIADGKVGDGSYYQSSFFVTNVGASTANCAIQLYGLASTRIVGPLRRNLSAGVFNDNDVASARERVVSILRGFQSGSAIPPVEIVEAHANYGYRYKLTHGAHRFYCSLAAGYTHVPVVEGFDITSL